MAYALHQLPADLLASARGVVWNAEIRDGKSTKVPYCPHAPAQRAAVDDPETWAPIREAISAFEDGKADGVGIVLGEGLVGVDLDDVRDPDTGVLTAHANAIIRALDSYTEVSPSGTGVHVLLRGTLPPGGRRKGSVEMYCDGRYFTLTGRHLAGTPTTIEERSAALARLHRDTFSAPPPREASRRDVTYTDDDAARLAKAHTARNGAKFSALWAGDTGEYGSPSEADQALCNLLAFWLDADADRIDRAFRQSGLMREKWDERRGAATYGERTIARAMASCRETYRPGVPHDAFEPRRPPSAPPAARPLEPLEDAPHVADEGRQLAATGVQYLVDGIVPAYGMLGMCVAFAKVGKTTFGLALGDHVARGATFLDRPTQAQRVLLIAAEDPPEYTAYLARHLALPPDRLLFYRRPIVLDTEGLAAIAATVEAGHFGLVLIASWQAVVRSLVRDENDNAGAVRVVEAVKATARLTGIPWLIDAHSGKSEDQSDDADPSRAMRGASGAAGAADYMLSLRYANGPFGSQRRFSGKGRFVSFAPMVLDYDDTRGLYTVVSTSTKGAAAETAWRLIHETGALSAVPQTADAIARLAGLASDTGRVTSTGRRQVREALRGREGVRISTETRRGQSTTLYARAEGEL